MKPAHLRVAALATLAPALMWMPGLTLEKDPVHANRALAAAIIADYGRHLGDGKEIIARLDQSKVTLVDAIAAAEEHSRGRSVAVTSDLNDEGKLAVHVYCITGEPGKIMQCHYCYIARGVIAVKEVSEFPVSKAESEQDDPVQANRALAAAFESAWNAHDMDVAFRRLLTDDVVWVNVNAGHGKGIEPVVRGHADVHAGKFKESVMTLKSVDVALVKPGVALVHVGWEMRGDRDNDGTPREPREGLFTWVTVKEGAAWKIRASHNTNKTEVR